MYKTSIWRENWSQNVDVGHSFCFRSNVNVKDINLLIIDVWLWCRKFMTASIFLTSLLLICNYMWFCVRHFQKGSHLLLFMAPSMKSFGNYNVTVS